MPQDFLETPDRTETQMDDREFAEQAAKRFEWDRKFAEKSQYEPRLRKLCDDTKETLNIDPEILFQDIDSMKKLGKKIYEGLYPDRKLNYHNDIHGELTAIADVEMLIEAMKLLAERKYNDKFQNDKNFAQKFLRTNLAASNLHELREWWLRNKDEVTTADTIKKVAEGISSENGQDGVTGLNELGVNLEDVDLIVELDDFPVLLPDSLKKAINHTVTENSLFNQDTDFKIALLREAGGCLRTADFLQTLNENYITQVSIVGIDIEPVELSWGPLALAKEFFDERKASLPADWVIKDESGNITDINWANVGTSPFIYNEKIVPNLKYGKNKLSF